MLEFPLIPTADFEDTERYSEQFSPFRNQKRLHIGAKVNPSVPRTSILARMTNIRGWHKLHNVFRVQ